MGELLRGATLVELSPVTLERADLRIDDGRIVARGPGLQPEPSDRVTDLDGRLVMPGLVSAHTHLYTSLGRGLPPPPKTLRSLVDVLEQVWWQYDRGLDEETVELSAQVGAAEALLNGVTTVFDLHSSPRFIEGSLTALRRGIDALGLRSVLSYEVSDRNGPEARDAALRETEEFMRRGRTSRCRAMVGGHSSFTLDPDTLEAMVALGKRFETGIHMHLAESPHDERDARERFESDATTRLSEAGAIDARSVLAHCTHLAWEELSLVQRHGAWLVHCPRSNMNNAVGYAPAGKFGARKALGTDGFGADLLGEAQVAFFKGQEAGFPIDPARWLGGGHTLATEVFGTPIGALTPGAAADLVVLDYPNPTPLVAENLAAHLAYGMGASHVDAVMVDGAWRLWARQLLSVDYEELCAHAREAAQKLWNGMATG